MDKFSVFIAIANSEMSRKMSSEYAAANEKVHCIFFVSTAEYKYID